MPAAQETTQNIDGSLLIERLRSLFQDAGLRLDEDERQHFVGLVRELAEHLPSSPEGVGGEGGETQSALRRFQDSLHDETLFRRETRQEMSRALSRPELWTALGQEANLPFPVDPCDNEHVNTFGRGDEAKNGGRLSDAWTETDAVERGPEVLRLFRELTDDERQQLVAGMTANEKKDVTHLIKAAEQQVYRELVFGKQKPTITRFNRWLSRNFGVEPSTEKAQIMGDAARFVRDELKAEFTFRASDGEEIPCRIDTTKSHSGRLRFFVREHGSGGRVLHSRYGFPEISVKPA